MSDVVPVDESQSVDVLDESMLLPLSDSAGALADDPNLESEHSEFPNQGKLDVFDLEPDEVPGEETRPQDAVLSPEEDE
ncbi:MAG TPA: hypothetical protein VIH10_07145 [Kribbella sp.]|jgi:hypothetical protein